MNGINIHNDVLKKELLKIQTIVNATVVEENTNIFKKWIKSMKLIKTGKLFRSIFTSTKQNGNILEVKTDNMHYGLYLNKGTPHMSPRPFAYNAVRELANNLMRMVKEKYGK